jgi:hypothetical protein
MKSMGPGTKNQNKLNKMTITISNFAPEFEHIKIGAASRANSGFTIARKITAVGRGWGVLLSTVEMMALILAHCRGTTTRQLMRLLQLQKWRDWHFFGMGVGVGAGGGDTFTTHVKL